MGTGRNFRQIIQVVEKAIDATTSALRVCVANADTDPVPVTFTKPTTPKITKLTSPATPNNSFSHTFTDGTKKFRIYIRNVQRIEYNWVNSDFSLVPTEVGKTSLGGHIEEDGVTLTSQTIFLRVNAVSKEVYIEEWY